MNGSIWVLGATGRSGRGIARRLHGTGHTVVLAGRDAVRLAAVAEELGGAEVVSGSFESLMNDCGRPRRQSWSIRSARSPARHSR